MSRYPIPEELRAVAVATLHEIILNGSDRDRNAAIRNLVNVERHNLKVDEQEKIIARLDAMEAKMKAPPCPRPDPKGAPLTPNQIANLEWLAHAQAQRERWEAAAEAGTLDQETIDYYVEKPPFDTWREDAAARWEAAKAAANAPPTVDRGGDAAASMPADGAAGRPERSEGRAGTAV